MTTLSGNVTLSGSAQANVPVLVIDTNNSTDPSNWAVAATATTDSNGDWSVSGLANDATERYHAIVQYDDGTQYNALSKPYLSTPDVIPDSGVLRWTFDDADTESGSALDVWNDNDGIINGATTGVSGGNQTYTTNEAYSFDGTDDNVDSSVGDIATASVAAWANLDTADSNNRHIIATRSSGTGFGLRYSGASSGGAWDLYVFNNGSADTVVGSQAATNTWVHLVAVLDDNNSITLYEDGTEVATTSIGSRELGAAYRVGERPDGGNLFDGRIDDPRIYNKALTSTEVSDLYNTGSISG